MNKLILTTSFLLVAVFTVAYLYFSNISAGTRNIDQALSLIPGDASLIFEIKNDRGVYEIFSDYQLFSDLVGKTKQKEISELKSLLMATNRTLKDTEGQNIFLSFHPGADSVDLLWIMPLPSSIKADELRQSLLQHKNTAFRANGSSDTSISEISIKSINRTFFIHLNPSFLVGSYSREILAKALNSKTAKISGEMVAEINRANIQNQNSPATVFINFKSSISYFSNFFKSKVNGNFSLLNNFHALSTLNMNFKSDAMIFNGITNPDTARQNYLNLFLKQTPVRNPIKRLLPNNTANFISYGLSDYAGFHRDLQELLVKRNDFDKINLVLSQIRNETGIDPDRDLKKLWSNEFVTFQLSTQEKFGAIQLSNGRQLQFFTEPLSSAYSDDIRHLNYPGLFYYYFGDGMKQFNKPFYTIIDNQMILSNSAGSLQRYLTRYSRNPLFENEDFIHFEQLVADQSNISIFIHNKNSASNIRSLLKPEYAGNFRSEEFGFKNFYGLSYQLSSGGDHFFSNFYAGYNKGLIVSDEEQDPETTE